MLRSCAHFFDKFMRRYTPDPYIFAVLLTLLVFVLGLVINEQSVENMVIFWGKGFWSLIPFTLQMVMILVTGYIVATSKPISAFLKSIAQLAKTPAQAVMLTSCIAVLGCWLNWGFGLIVSAFLCRAVAKAVPKTNYKVLVASAYSGFLVWHGGLSGSIPLVLVTEGNFSLPLIGRLIPLSETLWSSTNLLACIGLFILLPVTNMLMGASEELQSDIQAHTIEEEEEEDNFQPQTPAEYLEHTPIIPILVGVLGLAYILYSSCNGGFKLDLNQLNFIFLFLGILLHGRVRHFLKASGEAAKKISPILIQYPFYAGIMGMMQSSGLAASISELFVAISNEQTFPLFTFLSAGIVNFFVPSGGGQWAVQSPIVIPAAIETGASLSKSVMAVAWGDAWTNMAQPFWALPLLAVAGLKIRDIMGYCMTILIVSGIFLSLVFLLS